MKVKGAVTTGCILVVSVVVAGIAAIYYHFQTIYHYIILPNPELIVTFNPQLRLLEKFYQTKGLRYSDVCWLTSHNSFAYKNQSQLVKKQFFPNQILTIDEQLAYGVKSFMVDLHYDNVGRIVLAHGGAYLFEQSFLDFLNIIRKWLENHKDDILTIHFESYINDNSKIMDAIRLAGLESCLFDIGNRNDWPTLEEMKNTNKRLVIFSDKKLDTVDTNRNHVYGIMHTTRYIETDYNLADSPCCEMRNDNRATIGTVSSYPAPNLFVMNHFYKVMIMPSIPIGYSYLSPISDVNSYERIYKRICSCFSTIGKWPNFIAFDFVGALGGQELKIILDLNTQKINKWCSGASKCP